MGLRVRVIDTGLRAGTDNIAFDAAMTALHAQGAIPDTIRFLRFKPTALVGRHQAISREIKVAYARAHGIGVARRITGGGAIYFDEGMLGWELVMSRRRLGLPTLAETAAKLCTAAAEGLSRAFGIDARFRPRNDIEVAGRKLSGTGGFFDGDTMFYQGTVLIDTDPAAVMACLNVPRAKLEKRALDRPEARIVTLAELLGTAPDHEEVARAIAAGLCRGLGIEADRAMPSEEEEARAREIETRHVGTRAFIYDIDQQEGADVATGSASGAGGSVTAFIRTEGPAGAPRIREALITGDFFVTPARLIMDLEAALRGVGVAEAGQAVEAFFAAARPDMISLSASDFRAAIERALGADETRAARS